jgi:peptide methionine sulfoxide reductase MsrA
MEIDQMGFMDPIVTAIEPLNGNFWEAEENHQNRFDTKKTCNYT